jgi:hypothetical protein
MDTESPDISNSSLVGSDPAEQVDSPGEARMSMSRVKDDAHKRENANRKRVMSFGKFRQKKDQEKT